MVPESKRIIYLSQEEFNSMPTGSLEVGVTYRISLTSRPIPDIPIKAPKPWEKWKQHPKGPGKHIKQAREQKWGGGRS